MLFNLQCEKTNQEALQQVETLRQDFFELEKALRYHDSVSFAIQMGAIVYTIEQMSMQFGMEDGLFLCQSAGQTKTMGTHCLKKVLIR